MTRPAGCEKHNTADRACIRVCADAGSVNKVKKYAGYTGSIQVKLFNHGQDTYAVHKGDKVSQPVVMPIITPALELVEELDATIWLAGMDEAIRRLNPSHVVCYGGDIGYTFPCGASYIANHNAERIGGKS